MFEIIVPLVQVYDPKKNVWRSIAELSAKRWKCGLVELGGFLYAVGGMDSPRAGFWGAPLNTGKRDIVRHFETLGENVRQ